MIGRKKLAVGLTAVVALTTLAGAGVASAHGGGVRGGEYADSIKERAAEILGVEPADLADALKTARHEAARAHLEERLSAAVEAGTITQAEMDEILAWLDTRPEVVDQIGHGPHIGILPLHARGIEARLDAMVQAGTITQEQADEVKAWLDAAPEALSELMPERGGFGGHHGPRPHGRGHRGPIDFGGFPVPDASGAGSMNLEIGTAA